MAKQDKALQTEEWLAQARAAHAARDVNRAAALYQQVLTRDAKHLEALNVMGMLLAEHGRLQEGLQFIDKAVAAHPSVARIHFHRGVILEHLQRFADAVQSYDKAIARDAQFAPAYVSRGIALERLGTLPEAMESFCTAISLNPNMADAYFNYANTLVQAGRAEEALPHYEQALLLAPNNPVYHANKGTACKILGRLADAATSYRQAVTLHPAYASAHNELGKVLADMGETEAALTSFDRAITCNVQFAEAFNNKALALAALRRYEEALACLHNALAINPAYADAHNNKGFILQQMGRYAQALTCYDAAITHDPSHARYYSNKSMLLLMLGNFREGWELFEWRRKRKDIATFTFNSPAWDGKAPLAGKTLLVQAEQGMGDFIQFCRYVPELQARGAKVVLRVHPPLMKLLAGLAETVAVEDAAPAHDLHCLIMSLPFLLGSDIDSIPADIPYLQAEESRLQEWKQRLGTQNKKRVGLVWSGSKLHKNDHNRSIALEKWEQVLKNADIEFHTLQKDITAGEAKFLNLHNVVTHAQYLSDFTDTAALITLMDVVVTVDTSAAHLAGALGKPTWILLPLVPDFRWMLNRADSPWYPTATLMRQKTQGEWQPVIEDVMQGLQKL